ncbi:hypothetical protein KL86PLE_70197 [uncultured Pleomorphomonas sp.]|uniref:Uncharacterized protein n=1 Tax=uncultured Pleomorphomonas sp. TaxID=442121 RepID=A0A212LLS7_9HYPH|nr:hypothetical protein KL86PLE_70197 [uncultured Pleomorphomonas sp.]
MSAHLPLDVAEPRRAEPVQRLELAVRVPPLLGHRREAVDFGLIDAVTLRLGHGFLRAAVAAGSGRPRLFEPVGCQVNPRHRSSVDRANSGHKRKGGLSGAALKRFTSEKYAGESSCRFIPKSPPTWRLSPRAANHPSKSCRPRPPALAPRPGRASPAHR